MISKAKNMGQDLSRIKEDIELIKNILMENYELSEEAKAQLYHARKTQKSQYISHEEVKKRILE